MRVIHTLQKIDGVGAAAILLRYFKLHNKDAKIKFGLNVSENHDSLLFLLDIPPDMIDQNEIILAEKNNCKIAYWNCHQKSEREDFAIKHSLKFQRTNTCAAQATWEEFLVQDKISQQITTLAADIELWQNTKELSTKLNNLIASNYDTHKIVQHLAQGIFWTEEFEQALKDYVDKKEKMLRQMMKSILIKKCLDINFAYVLASNFLLSSEAGQNVLEKHKAADIAVILYPDGRITFRRKDNITLNLVDIAKLFNGGGHEFAAGAKLNFEIKKENLNEIITKLDQEIKNFLIQKIE